jgi:hypothetical protein
MAKTERANVPPVDMKLEGVAGGEKFRAVRGERKE